jgi:aminocarboxymuconate-semialdehyde decarboxylase
MRDLQVILEQMKKRRVDMYALSMTHPMVYWAPPAFGLKLSQVANDETSSAHVRYPDKFVGTIMLPLQDPKLALGELDRAAKLPGMRAVNMGENVNGKNISDKSFWPIWQRCESLGLPLFLHNLNPTDHERLFESEFSMMNVLGNPFEAGIAAEAMMLSGTLDAFPNLDVYLPHAGGTFPWLVWRTEHAQERGQFKSLKSPASSYLRRFYYDLIIDNPKLMRVLIEMVGVDRIVCGTDFPQGMGIKQPVEMVESIPNITPYEREMILCENPARLLKISN